MESRRRSSRLLPCGSRASRRRRTGSGAATSGCARCASATRPRCTYASVRSSTSSTAVRSTICETGVDLQPRSGRRSARPAADEASSRRDGPAAGANRRRRDPTRPRAARARPDSSRNYTQRARPTAPRRRRRARGVFWACRRRRRGIAATRAAAATLAAGTRRPRRDRRPKPESRRARASSTVQDSTQLQDLLGQRPHARTTASRTALSRVCARANGRARSGNEHKAAKLASLRACGAAPQPDACVPERPPRARGHAF